MRVSSDLISLLLIIAICFGFLIARRCFLREAFEDMPVQCGVDMPPCSKGSTCSNGWCSPGSTPPVRPNTLPVFP